MGGCQSGSRYYVDGVPVGGHVGDDSIEEERKAKPRRMKSWGSKQNGLVDCARATTETQSVVVAAAVSGQTAQQCLRIS